MSTIYVKNALFWDYKGRVESSWYLCGDNSNAEMREAYVCWCLKHGCNTVLLCLQNEELISMFKPGKYMEEWNSARVDMTAAYIRRVKAAGLMVAIAFFDGPEIPGAKYHPILRCDDAKHAEFIKIVCKALYNWVDLWLVGCETNRYWSSDKVEAAISVIKQYAPMRFVGTHEQGVGQKDGKWIMTRRVPRNAMFHCHETSNHPKDGDKRSAADMVDEVKHLVAHAGGVPIWVGETNLNQWCKQGREQSRALAEIDGVYGVPGPT